MAAMAHTIIMDEWPVGDDRWIVVSLVEFDGRWRLDLRIWFRAEDGSVRPGRGLGLRVWHLDRLAAAIEKARRGAVARELIPPRRSEDDE